jgi:succinyl-CoA synthetase beta subunit
MDGNIGCLVNGAGLAMATMDIIKLYGGKTEGQTNLKIKQTRIKLKILIILLKGNI